MSENFLKTIKINREWRKKLTEDWLKITKICLKFIENRPKIPKISLKIIENLVVIWQKKKTKKCEKLIKNHEIILKNKLVKNVTKIAKSNLKMNENWPKI